MFLVHEVADGLVVEARKDVLERSPYTSFQTSPTFACFGESQPQIADRPDSPGPIGLSAGPCPAMRPRCPGNDGTWRPENMRSAIPYPVPAYAPPRTHRNDVSPDGTYEYAKFAGAVHGLWNGLKSHFTLSKPFIAPSSYSLTSDACVCEGSYGHSKPSGCSATFLSVRILAGQHGVDRRKPVEHVIHRAVFLNHDDHVLDRAAVRGRGKARHDDRHHRRQRTCGVDVRASGAASEQCGAGERRQEYGASWAASLERAVRTRGWATPVIERLRKHERAQFQIRDGVRIRRPHDAALRNEGGDEMTGRHVERRIVDVRAFRCDALAAK